ncbi:MAG: FkbM family methyltransferase [Ruminococcus sp.]|nr:FkbM family methyltransferase [Ruminococcus sp.]
MLSFIKENTNCWDILKAETKPIYIYGMGDGAVKILNVFKEYNIKIAGIFASDEFVRGHSFMGFKVMKLSEVEAICNDFVIVLAFAVGRNPMYNNIVELSKRHTLYAPDVPVVVDGTLFTLDYCKKHEYELETVYNILEDEKSRQTFSDVINFRISGKIEYLLNSTATKEEVFTDILKLSQDETYLDLGAYNGDTILEFLNAVDYRYNRIIGLEPNAKNFRRLTKNTSNIKNLDIYNYASWDTEQTLLFSSGAGRMSTIRNNATNKVKEVKGIPADSLFSKLDTLPTFLKMDVEGAENHAIVGSQKIIKNGCKLAISLYHRNEDIFAIPLQIKELNPNFKFYIRKQLYIPAWETNLYCV